MHEFSRCNHNLNNVRNLCVTRILRKVLVENKNECTYNDYTHIQRIAEPEGINLLRYNDSINLIHKSASHKDIE